LWREKSVEDERRNGNEILVRILWGFFRERIFLNSFEGLREEYSLMSE